MQNTTPHISVVSPVYRGEKMVAELVRRIKENVATITEDFEIILVNDASPDASWAEIQKACVADVRVKGIDLSRNFGQHYAITAGLHYAKGEWVVVMDCDLQDRPEEIPNLYRKAQEGYDIVLGSRKDRKDSFFKRFSNKFFYSVMCYLTDTKIDNKVGSFRIMNRKVVLSYNSFTEQSRYFGGLMNWMGFEVTTIDIIHDNRAEGKSSYSFKKLLELSLDAMLSFSDKPLRLSVKIGVLLMMVSSIFIVYKIVLNVISDQPVLGWSSLMAAMFFCSGLIILVLGIIGLYVGKIFLETKRRPLYLIKNQLNFNDYEDKNYQSNQRQSNINN